MIEMLERLSPVPIEFVSAHPNHIGVYWGKTSICFERKIEIDKSLQQHQCIAILAHEIGHALCDEKDCKCMKNDIHIEREIHAHKYALRFLLKHKQKLSLAWLLEKIEEHLERCFNKEALPAAKCMMKLKLWQKCLDYVNNP